MSGARVHGLFAIPVMVSEAEYALDGEARKVIDTQETLPNRGGSRYSKNTYILALPELQGLKNFLQTQLEIYAHDLLKINRETKFCITQSWLNYSERGAQHLTHYHPNSLVSGSFYIAGDICPIRFQRRDPILGRAFMFRYDEPNIFNGGAFDVPNEKNKAVLFPSAVEHSVVPNPSGQVRISLAFNTFFKGPAGPREDLAELIIN